MVYRMTTNRLYGNVLVSTYMFLLARNRLPLAGQECEMGQDNICYDHSTNSLPFGICWGRNKCQNSVQIAKILKPHKLQYVRVQSYHAVRTRTCS